MNLPNLSNQSDQHKTKKKASPKKMSEKDLPLKLAAARAFMCQDYLAKINLGLSETPTGQVEKAFLSDITDIDVMAIKYHYDFTPYIVCMSCKGGRAKSLSPIKESFYLKGVMNYFGGNRGYVVFSDKPVSSHARILATKLDIVILHDQEFNDWCRIAQDSCDIDHSKLWERKAFDTYIEEFTKIQQLEPLRSYLSVDYWFYHDFRNIQNLIAHTGRVKDYLNKSSLPIRLVVLEVGLHFALSVLDLCRYVCSAGIKELKDHIAAYLFGGITSLRSRQNLYRQVEALLKNKGVVDDEGPKLPGLIPEYTDQLVELVYRWISKPWAAVNVPQVIQYFAWKSALCSIDVNIQDNVNARFNDMSLKFADNLLEFLSYAAKIQREKIL